MASDGPSSPGNKRPRVGSPEQREKTAEDNARIMQWAMKDESQQPRGPLVQKFFPDTGESQTLRQDTLANDGLMWVSPDV